MIYLKRWEYEYSRKMYFFKHLMLMVYSSLYNRDITDTSLHFNVNKSQLSKLNDYTDYRDFVLLLYRLLRTFIISHNYNIYHKILNIIRIKQKME